MIAMSALIGDGGMYEHCDWSAHNIGGKGPVSDVACGRLQLPVAPRSIVDGFAGVCSGDYGYRVSGYRVSGYKASGYRVTGYHVSGKV